MSEFSEGTPVTFGMLREALDGCGLAVGFALAGALDTAGTDRSRILSIAESLQTLSADPKPFPGAAAAPAAGEQPAAPAPAENAAPAPAENAAPAPATDTPSTTQGETNVEGTPTNSEAAPAENAAPIAIAGRVSYHVPSGGSGLRFVSRDGDGDRRLRELIRRLRAS